MFVENLCGPAVLYLGFSLTQIVIDLFRKAYNTAIIKSAVAIVFTTVLNMLCKQGLTVISWFVVFIPFVTMTLVTGILLYVFGLAPFTGKLQYSTSSPSQPINPAIQRPDVQIQPTQPTQPTQPAHTTQQAHTTQPTQPAHTAPATHTTHPAHTAHTSVHDASSSKSSTTHVGKSKQGSDSSSSAAPTTATTSGQTVVIGSGSNPIRTLGSGVGSIVGGVGRGVGDVLGGLGQGISTIGSIF